MSYCRWISADTTDREIQNGVAADNGNKWAMLNDLERTAMLHEAYQYRHRLIDIRGIATLFSMQHQFSSTEHPGSPQSSKETISSSSPMPSTINPHLLIKPSSDAGPRPEALDFAQAFYQAYDTAAYARGLFIHLLERKTPRTGPLHPSPALPSTLTYERLEDAQHIAERAVEAWCNPRKISWRLTEYSGAMGKRNDGRNDARERVLAERFPPGPMFPSQDEDWLEINSPATIVDADGCILAWYLPDVVSRDAQADWLANLPMLDLVMKQESKNSQLSQNDNFKPVNEGNKSQTGGRQGQPIPSWRRDPKYFNDGDRLSPGIRDIAACWFQAGHGSGNGRPEVSKSLKTPKSFVSKWLEANVRFLAISTSILAVTHPEQFMAGLDMLDKFRTNPDLLRTPEDIGSILKSWATVFSGVSVICNRSTPPHRDIGGNENWYDILMTMGTYKTTKLRLPNLRTTFAYRPGTAFGICGRVLPHAVDPVEEGDRACFAWFMREDVREYLNVHPGEPSKTDSAMKPLG